MAHLIKLLLLLSEVEVVIFVMSHAAGFGQPSQTTLRLCTLYVTIVNNHNRSTTPGLTPLPSSASSISWKGLLLRNQCLREKSLKSPRFFPHLPFIASQFQDTEKQYRDISSGNAKLAVRMTRKRASHPAWKLPLALPEPPKTARAILARRLPL